MYISDACVGERLCVYIYYLMCVWGRAVCMGGGCVYF